MLTVFPIATVNNQAHQCEVTIQERSHKGTLNKCLLRDSMHHPESWIRQAGSTGYRDPPSSDFLGSQMYDSNGQIEVAQSKDKMAALRS